jgi:hypothetical protein
MCPEAPRDLIWSYMHDVGLLTPHRRRWPWTKHMANVAHSRAESLAWNCRNNNISGNCHILLWQDFSKCINHQNSAEISIDVLFLPCARFRSNESANCGLQESTNQILEISLEDIRRQVESVRF